MRTSKYFLIITAVLVFLLFGPKSVHAADKLFFIHQNHQSSTSISTDQNGKVVGKETYYPYGSTQEKGGIDPSERGYTGQISDIDQTGLYYYNARYYNPLIAKFTQADTLGDGLNRYSYVGSNPIIFTDPSGHQSCDMTDYICRHMDELVAEGGSSGGGNFSSNWSSTLSSYNTYVDIQTTSPTAVSGNLAVGGLSLVPLGIACALNPMCASIAVKAAAVVDVVDTAIDTLMCTAGDLDACGYIANHIPGAGLADNFYDEFVESSFHARKHFGDSGVDLPMNAEGARQYLDIAQKVVDEPDIILKNPPASTPWGQTVEQYSFYAKHNDEYWMVILRDTEGIYITSYRPGFDTGKQRYKASQFANFLEKELGVSEQISKSDLPNKLLNNWETTPSLDKIYMWDFKFNFNNNYYKNRAIPQ